MGINILYVGFFSLPDKDAAANRVMNNAKALRECGHNVIFIDEQVDYEYESIEQSLHIINGFETWTMRRPVGLKEYITKMISIDEIIKVARLYKKIDIIIAYNYPSIALKKLLSHCHKNGIKLASDCTEWYSGKEYSFPKNYLCATDSFYRMRVIHKRLDGIICISSFLTRYYSKNNNVFLPPLVDISSDVWNQNDYVLDKTKLNIMYAGNPGKSKERILPVIKAIASSKEKDKIRFRIIGITKDQFIDLFPNEQEMVDTLGESVLFLGRIPHNEVIQILKASDFMVFIRDDNRVSNAGFSTKFVEAISSSTPVITTKTGDLEYFVQQTSGGVLLEEDVELFGLLNKDITELKQFKASCKNTDLFDYHNYVSAISVWISKMV